MQKMFLEDEVHGVEVEMRLPLAHGSQQRMFLQERPQNREHTPTLLDTHLFSDLIAEMPTGFLHRGDEDPLREGVEDRASDQVY